MKIRRIRALQFLALLSGVLFLLVTPVAAADERPVSGDDAVVTDDDIDTALADLDRFLPRTRPDRTSSNLRPVQNRLGGFWTRSTVVARPEAGTSPDVGTTAGGDDDSGGYGGRYEWWDRDHGHNHQDHDHDHDHDHDDDHDDCTSPGEDDHCDEVGHDH
jgi:hypothetical protein